MPLRGQHIQKTAHAADDILCPQEVSLPDYLPCGKAGLAIAVFLPVQPPDILQHLFRIQVTALLVYIHELGARVSQAAQVFRIVQSVLQIHVHIITVRLQRLDLPVTQNILQGITAAGTFLITVDDNLFFTVDRTPNISFAVGVPHLYLAPDLVAVNDGILLHSHTLERLNQSPGTPTPFSSQLSRVMRLKDIPWPFSRYISR